MRSLTLRSPAKVNLYLQVLGKRPDGYHNLKTIFERIDLCDEIRLTPNLDGAIRISCSHPQVPLGPKNLVYRIAALLKKEHKISAGVNIHITKHIPVAAGLAGGSSNAATVLLGLNRLWNLSLNRKKLWEYGQAIGSDVPFFLYDTSWALGEGRGDKITPLSLKAKLWHILIVPRVKMYSREVFTRLNLQLTKKWDDVNILIRSLTKNDIKMTEKLLFNDLESSILEICPRLLTVKERLTQNLNRKVIFSGSGPAVYGLTASKQEAQHVKRILEKRYSQVFVVRTL